MTNRKHIFCHLSGCKKYLRETKKNFGEEWFRNNDGHPDAQPLQKPWDQLPHKYETKMAEVIVAGKD